MPHGEIVQRRRAPRLNAIDVNSGFLTARPDPEQPFVAPQSAQDYPGIATKRFGFRIK